MIELKKKLNELNDKINDFNLLKTEIDELSVKLKKLSEKLADGNLSSISYEKASTNLESEKKRLEERLWALRNELFKDDYEKPF